MNRGIHYENLKAHLLPMSESDEFEVARHEWRFTHVEWDDDLTHCPCSVPIKEMCFITNERTGHETYVGNVCINRFLGIDLHLLIDGLRKIEKDPEAGPNLAVIEYAIEHDFLQGDNEARFLWSMYNKKKRSVKQKAWLKKINWRIMNQICPAKRRSPVLDSIRSRAFDEPDIPREPDPTNRPMYRIPK